MKKKLLFVAAVLSIASAASAQTKPDGTPYSKYIQAVDEYVPAPGQFVNFYPEYTEGDDAAKMAAKCTAAIADNKDEIVSLGGYGGYITFHFDHSVANIAGKYDFYIAGNASRALFEGYNEIGGSSEPGIVMVSKDENGNGLPDDKWYELSGSADVDSIGKVIYDYEITYKYNAMQDVPWTDNQGRSGTIDRNNYHKQEYYPLWLDKELTFSGTLLPNNGVDTEGDGQRWVLMFYRYGYVDNKPNLDKDACSFNIEWAVDENRNPVQLDRIDFVRVYSALNQKCGWIGETSTEVRGAEDLHLEESIAATSSVGNVHSADANATEIARYSADGRKLAAPTKGLNIIKMSDGTTRKVVY